MDGIKDLAVFGGGSRHRSRNTLMRILYGVALEIVKSYFFSRSLDALHRLRVTFLNSTFNVHIAS